MSTQRAARRPARSFYPLGASRRLYEHLVRHTIELRTVREGPIPEASRAACAFNAARQLDEALLERGIVLCHPRFCVVAFDEGRPVAAIEIPVDVLKIDQIPSRIVGIVRSLEFFGTRSIVVVISAAGALLNPTDQMEAIGSAILSHGRVTGTKVDDVVIRGGQEFLSLAQTGQLEKWRKAGWSI